MVHYPRSQKVRRLFERRDSAHRHRRQTVQKQGHERRPVLQSTLQLHPAKRDQAMRMHTVVNLTQEEIGWLLFACPITATPACWRIPLSPEFRTER